MVVHEALFNLQVMECFAACWGLMMFMYVLVNYCLWCPPQAVVNNM